ncbi:hypothetical protein RRF57_000240 [Xylaria bambusicola]|uniref:Uncharacterized protein n=1 Tax=Xylaria bambusicola TaxID=326684 RepID=A0AAN7UE82_9PEZI
MSRTLPPTLAMKVPLSFSAPTSGVSEPIVLGGAFAARSLKAWNVLSPSVAALIDPNMPDYYTRWSQ